MGMSLVSAAIGPVSPVCPATRQPPLSSGTSTSIRPSMCAMIDSARVVSGALFDSDASQRPASFPMYASA